MTFFSDSYRPVWVINSYLNLSQISEGQGIMSRGMELAAVLTIYCPQMG